MVLAVLVGSMVFMAGVAVSTQGESVLDLFPEYKALSDSVTKIKQDVSANTNGVAVLKPVKDYVDKRNPGTAFAASILSFRVLPKNTILKFDNVMINVGNAYDQNSGVFTAKHAGLYQFSVSLTQMCIGNCMTQIWQNDVAKQGGFTHGDTYEAGTINTVLNLSVGDRVYVKSRYADNTFVYATGAGFFLNSFSGFLI